MGLNNQDTGLNRKALSRATIPTSLQARQVALWALRMALGEVRNDFFNVHHDRFIEIAGAQLKWSKSSFIQVPGDFLVELASERRLKPGIVQRTMGFVH